MAKKKMTYEEIRDRLVESGLKEGKDFGPFNYTGDYGVTFTPEATMRLMEVGDSIRELVQPLRTPPKRKMAQVRPAKKSGRGTMKIKPIGGVRPKAK